jgi:ubiquinone biosynthesis protein UbiJ
LRCSNVLYWPYRGRAAAFPSKSKVMNTDSTDNSSRSGADGSPASRDFLQSLLSKLHPPQWVVGEMQNRLVIFLNHVLMQEPAAQERLKRQKGKPVRMQWGDFHLTLAATAAGLVERPLDSPKPELTMTLTQHSPLAIAQRMMLGDKPEVDVQGDVQLAAEVAWLVDNVRWDVEEDLSRVVGDATAHTIGRFARSAAEAVRRFADRVPRPPFGPGSARPPGADGGASGGGESSSA